MTTVPEQDRLPRCACGAKVKFAGTLRCEDCYADAAARWSGQHQNSDLMK